jgi:Ca2+-binding RTX toxin-like protein
VFAGNSADYTITQDPDGWYGWTTVTHNATGVEDWVISVEKLQFADGTIDAPGLRPELPGSAAVDVITAGDARAEIHGAGGNDQLTGGTQDDILNGGAGADELRGGIGNDTFLVDNEDTVIDGGEGYDSVYADPGLAEKGFNFKAAGTSVELVWGSLGADVIDATGVTTDMWLDGGWGDDVLIGGAGIDTLLGSEGIDTAVFTGNRADYAFEAIAGDGVTGDGVKVTNTATGAFDSVYTVENLKFADATFATGELLMP